MTRIVDPPEGWLYGFPAPLESDYKAQLQRAKYPEKLMDLALRASRYWDEPDDRN